MRNRSLIWHKSCWPIKAVLAEISVLVKIPEAGVLMCNTQHRWAHAWLCLLRNGCGHSQHAFSVRWYFGQGRFSFFFFSSLRGGGGGQEANWVFQPVITARRPRQSHLCCCVPCLVFTGDLTKCVSDVSGISSSLLQTRMTHSKNIGHSYQQPVVLSAADGDVPRTITSNQTPPIVC